MIINDYEELTKEQKEQNDNFYKNNERDKIVKGKLLSTETVNFKRLFCGSSQVRNRKVILVNEKMFDVVNTILLCGMPKDMKFEIKAKYSAYNALVTTDSIPVRNVPNIVVVDDFKKDIEEVYDIVTGDIAKSKYDVKTEKYPFETKPFDGAGLVSVRLAKKWAKELGLDYIPASFQFRAIPGIKGNVYTFDIKEFSSEYKKTKITDIWGKECDFIKDKIDCILTKSQFKFNDKEICYASYKDWRSQFDKVLTIIKTTVKDIENKIIDTQYSVVESVEGMEITDNMEIVGTYNRTFNISEISEKLEDLDDKALMCYQPLQTLNLSDEQIELLCAETVNKIKLVNTNLDEFLKFRGLAEKDEKHENNDKSKSTVPPFFEALKNNHALVNDRFIHKKITDDLKSMKTKTYVGKLIVNGNYQTLTPDIYGLAQYVFGIEVTGLLGANKVYSNYWNQEYEVPANECIYYYDDGEPIYSQDSTIWHQGGVKEIDLIRSPHVSQEHNVVEVMNTPDNKKWFMYQKSGIIVGIHDSILQNLGNADADGDHILSISNSIICSAAKEQTTPTIIFVPDKGETDGKPKTEISTINDINSYIDNDLAGMSTDIGVTVNKITILWSLIKNENELTEEEIKQHGGIEAYREYQEKIKKYIKIMTIVAGCVIDFAKTGIPAASPAEIETIVKKCKKPYFLQFKNKCNIAKEDMKASNAELNKATAEEIEEAKSYSDTPCTMNRICWYMQKQIGDLKPNYPDEENFDFTKLFFENDVKTRNATYQKVKIRLKKLHKEHDYLTGIIFHQVDENSDQYIENRQQYALLYSSCRIELLKTCNGNVNKLIDYMIHLYYTDKKFINCNKSILWNSFSAELIKRSTGNYRVKKYSNEKLKEQSEKLNAKLAKQKAIKHNTIIDCLDTCTVDNETGEIIDGIVKITTEELSAIKNKLIGDISSQKLLFVMLALYRKNHNKPFGSSTLN